MNRLNVRKLFSEAAIFTKMETLSGPALNVSRLL